MSSRSFRLLHISILVFVSVLVYSSHVAANDEQEYRNRAHEALAKLVTVSPEPFERTTHTGAQWFPGAGFGLFIHWGIHSTAGIEPSWSMMTGCPWQKDYIKHLGWSGLNNRDAYYALVDDFDPSDYDPDKWIAAAKKAGMTYAVLTSKHHDGFCLWPTEYGNLSTNTRLGGRDLIRPFIEACRRHGMKYGLYFSPRDWSYPGFPVSMDYSKPFTFPDGWTDTKNQAAFDDFYAYTTGQMSELLTRYGKIDLIWFDGMGWEGINDIRTEQTLAWVRELQPHIVINPRWGGVGDYETPEVDLPEDVPDGWWENCVSWRGHWGYSPHAAFLPNLWVMTKLVKARSWGGNFLLNVGPDGDGQMPAEYYAGLDAISVWMKKQGHTLVGADAVRSWSTISTVPVTRKNGAWYLHVLPTHEGPCVLRDVPEPKRVTHLNTGVELTTWKYDDMERTFSVSRSMTVRDPLDDVIMIKWETEPDFR